MVGYNYERTRR